MNNTPLVKVENVSRFYNGICAVNNISFHMNRGEILGLLGPNGAGKSSTMKMLSGVLACSSGDICVAGYKLATEARQAKTQLGYLPETPPLYQDLTVDEYLLFCGQLRQLKGQALQQALLNCKTRCGLQNSGRRLIGNLSKGYKQRIGIAQAIIHSPAVVILDEPTSGLDPNQILEIRRLIAELGEDHSVILSTHILQEVHSSCSRVLIINRGELVLDKLMTELDTSTNTGSLIVAFNNPPLPEEIQAFDPIDKVEVVDKNRFRIHYSAADAATQLTEHAVSQKWQMFELIPERHSLESVFIELTQHQDGRQA